MVCVSALSEMSGDSGSSVTDSVTENHLRTVRRNGTSRVLTMGLSPSCDTRRYLGLLASRVCALSSWAAASAG